jgi:NAD(P)-dependent dehydrogenase (short-subunit alcohol dehydrogenase family)
MSNRQKNLADQVLVITGASAGIGLLTARRAAARGAAVVLVSMHSWTRSRLPGEGRLQSPPM